ncbi:MAG: hypothetical protein FWC97_00560 [Treponema sp.]|nr:hypothetical protein [Treponema sp.]
MKNIFKLLPAFLAIIVLMFAACEGSMGETGPDGPEWRPDPEGPLVPPVDKVIRVDVDEYEMTVPLGLPQILTPVIYPDTAVVQTLLWELYDDASGEVVRLTRATAPSEIDPGPGFPMLVANQVMVTGIADGQAKIVVSALGGDDDMEPTIITVTVEGLYTRIAALSGSGTLTAYANERIPPNRNLFFDDDSVSITLTGAVPGITLTVASPGHMFVVGNNVTFTIEDITLRGIPGNTGGALVRVNNGGTLVMNTDSRLTGNVNTDLAANNNFGGGVFNLGRFYLRDGEISGNRSAIPGNGHGGGVFNLGVFIMEGGIISGNDSTDAGGGVSNGLVRNNVVTEGTFTMLDGSIVNNFANRFGGGVDNAAGLFMMFDGTISGNFLTNASAANQFGGGVFVNPGAEFVMHEGTISDNTGGLGGGVHISAAISSQQLTLPAGEFVMFYGTITRNLAAQTALGGSGGGVDVRGIFVMNDGYITSNEAENLGGGVNIGMDARFTMLGGNITDNAGGNAGGVENSNGIFQLVNGNISDNTAGAFPGNAMLRNTGGNARSHRGMLIGGTFAESGTLPNTSIALQAANGVLTPPTREGILANQLDWLRLFAVSGESYEIAITANEVLFPVQSLLPTGRTDVTITLNGAGVMRNINLTTSTGILGGSLFTVGSGVTLILEENITLIGRSGVIAAERNNSPLVIVNNGGVFRMNADTRLMNNSNNAAGALGSGGILVNNGGHFILDGGEISGNATIQVGGTVGLNNAGNGGGVRVEDGGRFDMLAGRIWGNTGRIGGGVFVNIGGVFQIEGGTIYGTNEPNTELRNTSIIAGSMSLRNAGTAQFGTFNNDVFSEDGNFPNLNTTIDVINGFFYIPSAPPPNAALNVHFDWLREWGYSGIDHNIHITAPLTTVAPNITVFPEEIVNATIRISGDTGTERISLSANGVLFDIPAGITLVLEDVTLMGRGPNADPVTDANNNHLVRVQGTLITNGNTVITGNTNSNTTAGLNGGAGVRVNAGGRFIMNNGTISRNTTSGEGAAFSPGTGFGAAVRIQYGGTFDMLGGTISGNSGSAGGGVFNAGTFRIVNGTIYGIDEANNALRNIARTFHVGDALHNADTGAVSPDGPGVSQHGTFTSVDTDGLPVGWSSQGDLQTWDLSLNVAGGVWVPPSRAGSVAAQLAWLRTFGTDGGDYEILITSSEPEVILPSNLAANFFQSLPTDRTITVRFRGVGGMRTITSPNVAGAANQGVYFIVPDGVTLILEENITLLGRRAVADGGTFVSTNNQPVVRVLDGGTFIMRPDSKITGNQNSVNTGGAYGSGVTVMNGGVFILDGGEISDNRHMLATVTNENNRGAGVHIRPGGRFDMLRGTISNNNGLVGGGVFVAEGATFRIGGGTIHGANAAVGIANISRTAGAASLFSMGEVQYGTFTGGYLAPIFTPSPSFPDFGTTAATIAVVDGDMVSPVRGTIPSSLTDEALAWITTFAQEDDTFTFTLAEGEETVLPPAHLLLSTLPAGRNNSLTLIGVGEGHTIRLPTEAVAANQGSLFVIPAGSTLVLENVTLEGRSGTALNGNIHPLVRVEGGTLQMNAGSRVMNNNNVATSNLFPNHQGGGVRVNSGTFVLNGGIISGNIAVTGAAGGGVHVAAGGTFDMQSGEIWGNSASALNGGGGVFVAGVADNPGTVNMSGGRIGVQERIEEPPAGTPIGNFTMGNTSGAGVNVAAGGVFNMTGGEIANNDARGATSAGGVRVVGIGTNPGTFNLINGAIRSNIAHTTTGTTAGGVRLDGAGAIFNMRGGTIAGNRAFSVANNAAGGVNVLNNAVFRISDGTIYGSNAAENLQNIGSGAAWDALFRATAHNAQHGGFDNGEFQPVANLPNSDNTLVVVDGELQ